MQNKNWLLVLFALAIHVSAAAEEGRLMRFPAISKDKIAFSYGGDLYIVDSSGGEARKITNHKGYEMFPRFSPDGKTIAFTGQYDGNTEIYTIPSDGGIPKRLTYTAVLDRDDVADRMGPNNIVMCWYPDGSKITYRSRKQSFNDFKGMLFNVSVKGGLSEELPFSVGGFCSYSEDGNQIAYNRIFREFRTWKYYKGGMADDIWIYDFSKKVTINITNNKAQDIVPMWIGNEIYYLSARERIMNLFVYNISTKETRKVTDFKEFDIKFPSADKQNIVFENGGYIYKFNTQTKTYSKVEIQIFDDGVWARDDYKDASKSIRSFAVSPNGERVVFGARGDIITAPSNKGITRNLTSSSGVHEQKVSWSPNGKYVAYLSDATGEMEIYIQDQDGSSTAVQITKNADTYKFDPVWSPDSRYLLWADRKLRLQYTDISSKEIHLILQSPYNKIENYSWSPDSKWVIFEQKAENHFTVISVYNIENKEIKNITDSWFDSYEPVFSRDGKYILFASAREFNPIYSQTEWNHAYINMSRIFMVLLSKNITSPFAPENNEVDLAGTAGKSNSPDTNGKGDKAIVKVNIDFDGIENRIISIPVRPSTYSNINCINNSVYYIDNAFGEAPSLKVYDLKKKEETEVCKTLNYCISANGKKMMLKEGDRWGIIDLPSGRTTVKESLDLSNMMVRVDYKEEWYQIYNECWRQMRDFFYVSNMHGLNWKAIHDKYAPLVAYVKHRDDLTYIIGEMIGELSIGHAYINSGEKIKAERIPIGLLGAKLNKDVSGFFKIDKILNGANWNNHLQSPLSQPGMKIKEGDYILAIDGKSLKEVGDIYSQLLYKVNKEVILTVNASPNLSGSHREIVVPIKDESNLYYYQWVQDNIKKVSEATNGEVGYIHIPDMVSDGLNEFAKYFYPQLNKKAIIIDDRGNGGGNVSPQIIERLQRELTRSKMFRESSQPSSVPTEMILGSKIMLIDQYSASDGDLFPYAFKKHKLGIIVGKRSWGGVVGISGSLPFIDGTDLRKPEFASYSADTSEWIIEGYGVDPDIDVENDPALEYIGIDQQLNKAIEIAKEQIKNYKGLPAIPSPPDKSK